MHDASEAYLGDMPHPIKHRSALGAAFKAAAAFARRYAELDAWRG
jgi:5'-deoxynucleotidase YfbR-like HD superfamily hydrolase